MYHYLSADGKTKITVTFTTEENQNPEDVITPAGTDGPTGRLHDVVVGFKSFT